MARVRERSGIPNKLFILISMEYVISRVVRRVTYNTPGARKRARQDLKFFAIVVKHLARLQSYLRGNVIFTTILLVENYRLV